MRLVVVPALIPDIGKVYDAYFEAFQDDPILEVLFPGGATAVFRQVHAAHTLEFWHKTESQFTLKCVDADTGEVVGMALWDVFLRERAPEEWKNPGIQWLEGEQRERAEKIVNPLWEKKEELWQGRRHVYCHVVAVKPEYRRQGAGTLLTQWGLDVAERAGLPVYLESSPSAYPLYQKLNFEKVGSVMHSAETAGVSRDLEVPLMVKMPSAAQGTTFAQWRDRGYPEGYQ